MIGPGIQTGMEVAVEAYSSIRGLLTKLGQSIHRVPQIAYIFQQLNCSSESACSVSQIADSVKTLPKIKHSR